MAIATQAPAVVAPIVVGAVVLPETGAVPTVAPVAEVVAPVVVLAPTEAPLTEAPAEPARELTRVEKAAFKIDALKAKIKKDQESLAKLEQAFRAIDLIDSVQQGSVIVARVGRAETSREVEAAVLGTQTLENGDKRYKISFGEGMDAEIAVIQESQIVDVKVN